MFKAYLMWQSFDQSLGKVKSPSRSPRSLPRARPRTSENTLNKRFSNVAINSQQTKYIKIDTIEVPTVRYPVLFRGYSFMWNSYGFV